MAFTSEERPGTGSAVRRLIWPTLLAVLVFAALVALGVWQLERLAWKEALIAAVAARSEAPPVAPPGPAQWAGLDLGSVDYLHVRVPGRFLAGEAHVFTDLPSPRGPLGGLGYWVVAPFETADGWLVLVNRGFVPEARKDPSSRSAVPAGDLVLDGVIRGPEHPNMFTPAAEPAKNMWFVRDPATLGPALGVPADRLAPYTIDATASMIPADGVPQAGETRRVFPNNHLSYAMTWFGLAVALVGVYVAFAWSVVRGGNARPPRPR